MVSNLSLCVTVGLALCQPNTMSEEGITQQKHYSELEANEIEELMEEVLVPITYTRSITNLDTILDTVEYVEGYYEYVEEQERLEQERIAEEQRRLEEEQRRIEEERQRELERIAWENRFDRKGYRQTYYSVVDGETKLGSLFYYGHPSIRNINNVMHYNDSQYGWLPIYAINMDEVVANGQNSRGTWNIYGSVIEVRQGDKTWNGIVLDACGACRYANKIDLWTYSNDSSLDVTGLDWRIVRYGY